MGRPIENGEKSEAREREKWRRPKPIKAKRLGLLFINKFHAIYVELDIFSVLPRLPSFWAHSRTRLS